MSEYASTALRWRVVRQLEELNRFLRKYPWQWYNVSPSLTDLAVYDILVVSSPMTVKCVNGGAFRLSDRFELVRLLSSFIARTSSGFARTLNTNLGFTHNLEKV